MHGYTWIATILCCLCFSLPGTVNSALGQKVGSPGWKREFERKRAEFKREFEASRQVGSGRTTASMGSSRNSIYANRSSSHHPSRSSRSSMKTNMSQPTQPKFNPKSAGSPIVELQAFHKATKTATSSKAILPFLSERQRSNRAAAESWGSKSDPVKFYRKLLGRVIRFDKVRTRGGVAYVEVVRGAGQYNTGTFTLKGEGNQWRMEASKNKFTHSHMPAAPKNWLSSRRIAGSTLRSIPI